jgi:aspartyl-tRNA(Asn)/glutamyl-tRNA(Gln) amidotransferase subunit A
MDATVAAAFDAACRRLTAAGVRLVDIDVPEFAELGQINRLGGQKAAEAWAWHASLLQASEARYDPRVSVRIRRGQTMLASDYLALLTQRPRWIAGVQRRLAGVNCETMLMPTVPVVAPAIAPLQASDELYGSNNLLLLRNPTFINFLDGCALSLPCHAPGEAPVGLMLAGLRGQDQHVLELGLALEQALYR